MTQRPPTAFAGPELFTRLNQILHRVRLRGDFYCQAELSAPWALEIPSFGESISFHVVTQGHCVLEVTGQDPVHLHSGDLALVPHGRGHTLSSGKSGTRAAQPRRVDLLPQEYLGTLHSRLTHGGGGEASRLICGLAGFEEPAARELARRMPPLFVLARDSLPARSHLLDTARFMGEELAAQRIGGDVIASRLADIIVVQLIRAWLSEARVERTGWFAAVHDEQIGPVLLAIHNDPGRPWTLADFARLARMSRSLFSARFSQLMGETPFTYLTRWRMDEARRFLAEDTLSISQIAQQVGYGSEAAFGRAFQRTVGTTPGTWRRSERHRRSSGRVLPRAAVVP